MSLLFDKVKRIPPENVHFPQKKKRSSHGQLNVIFQKPKADLDDCEYNKVKTAK